MKLAFAILLLTLRCCAGELVIQGQMPDERDFSSRFISMAESLRSAEARSPKIIRPSIILNPSPADYIFPPQTIPPIAKLTIAWDAPDDTNVFCYAIQETKELSAINTYHTIALATNVSCTITVSNWTGWLRIVSINAQGMNSDGAYEW